MSYNPQNPNGQATMANSAPVVIASDQSAVPVSGTFFQATQPVSLASLPSLAAGSNAIGSITNTTFASTQSGTWDINNISGTISLPTGAATESTLSTLNGKIPSNLTVTSTRLLVDGSGVTQPVSGTVTANAGTGNFTVVQSTATSLRTQAECYQGGTAVSSSNPLNVTLATSTTGGTSSVTGSLTNTAVAVSASAGQVYGWFIYNPNNSVAYVQFYNVAAGSVIVGTTTPVYSIGIPALSAANVFGPGITHSTAISIAATTARANGTAPSTSLDYNIFFK